MNYYKINEFDLSKYGIEVTILYNYLLDKAQINKTNSIQIKPNYLITKPHSQKKMKPQRGQNHLNLLFILTYHPNQIHHKI